MNEREGNIITKLATTLPKTYGYRLWKDDREIESSEFMKGKEVKKFASKELAFHHFDKYIFDITNIPIIKNKQALECIIIKFILLHAITLQYAVLMKMAKNYLTNCLECKFQKTIPE